MPFPSSYPLGVPLTNASLWDPDDNRMLQEGKGQRVYRGTLIYGIGSRLSWVDVQDRTTEHAIRDDSIDNIVVTSPPPYTDYWQRMSQRPGDMNDMAPGSYVAYTETSYMPLRMFNVVERYDGAVRIESNAPYFQPRDPGKVPTVVKLQCSRTPVSWTAGDVCDLQASCTLPPGTRVEIYKLPYRRKTQDIDVIQPGQNFYVVQGARLVTTITNNPGVVPKPYPDPIVSELGIPTLYLDVTGFEYGNYIDVWYNADWGTQSIIVGSFQVTEVVNLATYSQEIWWAQPILFPGGMPRDARRFPVAATLIQKAGVNIDKGLWQSRFLQTAPHVSIMMVCPMHQTVTEGGDKIKPPKERQLTYQGDNGPDSDVSAFRHGSHIKLIYFNHRIGTLWYRFFDGMWWNSWRDPATWCGEYIVDVLYYVEWGYANRCGIIDHLKPECHGFRCDWAYSRKTQPGWGSMTSPGDMMTKYDIFNPVAKQFNTSSIYARNDYGINKPFKGTSVRSLYSED